MVQPDILPTMRLVFSGADVMSATGDPTYSTPYLLAQKAGQCLQLEFLYHNKLSGRRAVKGLRVSVAHYVAVRPFSLTSALHVLAI